MRRGQLRHVEAVRYAFFINVITDRRIEDRLVVLAGDNAPRGEGAAITNGVDFELDGFVRVTCAQKISVQAMGLQRRWNRLLGGHEALSHDLPPKYTLLGEQTVAHKRILIGLARRDVCEYVGKAVHNKVLMGRQKAPAHGKKARSNRRRFGQWNRWLAIR